MGNCISCNSPTPTSSEQVKWITESKYNERYTPFVDDWHCPTCHTNFSNSWYCRDTQTYTQGLSDEFKKEQPKNTDPIWWVCCEKNASSCTCGIKLSFDECMFHVAKETKTLEDFYHVDIDRLDCSTCVHYQEASCKPLSKSLYDMVMSNIESLEIKPCDDYVQDDGVVINLESGLVTGTMIKLKYQLSK